MAEKIKKRSEIPEEYKWKLSHIYESDSQWEAAFAKLKGLLADISAFRGHLGDSSNSLYEGLELAASIERLFDNIIVYAHMSSHQDTSDSHFQALADRADSLGVEASGSLSFMTPEILEMDDAVLKQYLKEDERLSLFRRRLDEIRRMKPHVLSSEQEQLLAMTGELTNSPETIFSMITNADMKFPSVIDENGHEVELSNGRFVSLLESPNREFRKRVFDTFYTTYEKQSNTFAATLSANVKANLFISRSRHYDSPREASLFSDNVAVSVYDSLIETIHQNLPLMHRYVALRKRMLQVEELHLYDIYTPIVNDAEMKIGYNEAVRMVEAGLTALGEQYLKDLHLGLTSGWIDIYENEGKRSGAYSWGSYDSHPYVFLNHTDTLDSMFTLAHEMGHAMHSYYSNKNQPYVDSQYKIFVAEVASTLNEALVMNYLLQKTSDKKQKLYLLNRYMDNFRGTVFRQTMFAEFEKIIHEKAASGESLTCDVLSAVYHDLNVLYFGSDMVIDKHIDMEWARIPHFYSSFYVYKYATGFSAATSLSKGLLENNKTALPKYLQFLRSGGSDYPLELLKKAGVDMTTPAPVQEALEVFKQLLDEFEALLQE